jgi:Flp pilus assembly pilin Flp
MWKRQPRPRDAIRGHVIPLENDMSEMWVLLARLWSEDDAQDVAEYAVMLAVILVIVVGTIKIIGGKSNNVFSEVASSIQ